MLSFTQPFFYSLTLCYECFCEKLPVLPFELPKNSVALLLVFEQPLLCTFYINICRVAFWRFTSDSIRGSIRISEHCMVTVPTSGDPFSSIIFSPSWFSSAYAVIAIFVSVQFSGTEYILSVLQPLPPSIFTTFSSSQTENLCPLNTYSPSPPPWSPW